MGKGTGEDIQAEARDSMEHSKKRRRFHGAEAWIR